MERYNVGPGEELMPGKAWCYYCNCNPSNDNAPCEHAGICSPQPSYYSEWNADVDSPEECPNCGTGLDISPARFPERWVCDNCDWETPIIREARP